MYHVGKHNSCQPGWGVRERRRGWGPTPLLKHIPNDLTSSYQALPLKPRLPPQQHHRPGAKGFPVNLCRMYRCRLQQTPSHGFHTTSLFPSYCVHACLEHQALLWGLLPLSLHSVSVLKLEWPFIKNHLSTVLKILTCRSNSFPNLPGSVWRDPMPPHPTMLLSAMF